MKELMAKFDDARDLIRIGTANALQTIYCQLLQGLVQEQRCGPSSPACSGWADIDVVVWCGVAWCGVMWYGPVLHFPPAGPNPQVLERGLPPPPLPKGASGQQLVAKGASLRSPWAPKLPDAPREAKAPEGDLCPRCTPTLCLNPTQTLTPTPTLSLVLTLPLPLTRIEYWDRAGGERKMV